MAPPIRGEVHLLTGRNDASVGAGSLMSCNISRIPVDTSSYSDLFRFNGHIFNTIGQAADADSDLAITQNKIITG
jgi:hypothetical protein